MFLRSGLTALGALAAAASALKFLLFVLQDVSKRSALIDESVRNNADEETTSGPLARMLFLFLQPVFQTGYRGQILMQHLKDLGPDFSPALLHRQLSAHWKSASNQASVGENALLKACLKSWKRCVFWLVITRFAATGFKFAQPFVLRRVITMVGGEDTGLHDMQERAGMVAASAIVLFGVAFSQASFSHQMNGYTIRIRGGLIGHLFHKEHKLVEAEAKNAAAATLMSADLDGIMTGIPQCLEIPIGIIELALGIYLLSNSIGVSALTVLGPLIATTAVAYFIGRLMSPHLQSWNKSIEVRVAQTAKILPQLKAIKMLGLGPTVATLLQRLREDEIEVSKGYRRLRALSNGPLVFGDLVTPVLVIAAAFFGTAFHHRMEAVKVYPILALVALIQRPLVTLLHAASAISSTLGCFSRIQNFLLLPERQDDRSTSTNVPSPATSTQEMIRFGHADISPSGKSEPLLRNIDFAVKRGSMTGVIGGTGSGKSTLLRSVLGETRLLKGSIELGSLDVSYCGQTVWLRNKSIRANVIGKLPYDGAKFARVMRACCLDEDLARFPLGEDHLVGTNGANLSGGQRQRVSMARSAYAESDIVLLDDVFSSLDSNTAHRVLHGLCGQDGLLRQTGSTVLLATYLPESKAVIDQTVLLDGQGAAVLKTEMGSSELSDELFSVLIPPKPVMAFADDTEGKNVIRRSLSANEGNYSTSNDQPNYRKDGDIRLYKLFINPIGKMTMFLHALLVSFGSVLEIIPGIYLRVWIQEAPESSWFFFGYISVAILACFTGLLEYWLLYTKLSPRSSASLHWKVTLATVGATLAFLSATKTGTLLNLYSQDMALVSTGMPAAYMTMVYAGSYAVLNIGVVLSGATYLAAILPFMLIILYFVQRYYLHTSRQVRHLDLEMKAPLYTFFDETAAGLTHIRAFGWQESNIEEGLASLAESQKPYYALAAIQVWLSLILGLLAAVVGTLLVALALLLRGSSSQSAIGLSFTGILYLSQALGTTIRAWTTLEMSSSALARIFMFERDTPQERKCSAAKLPSNWPAFGNMEIQDLFAYYSRGDDSKPAIRDLSLTIAAGQRIGVIGQSGSGKTSLLLALLGFIEFDGRVEVDGVDISSIAPDELRSRIITITQDHVQFDASIRTNLLPFTMNDSTEKSPDETEKAAAPDHDLEVLLTSLFLWAPISKIGGLDAMLEDAGFSKGQLQLLSIARAIIRQRDTGSKLLLVDEATSSIDAETESIVNRAMRENFVGCTVLTIAHRQSSVDGADRIIRLHQGSQIVDDQPDV